MSVENTDLDVAIVGAGPAGISAGIWCAELGLRTMVMERGPQLGGQLPSIHGAIGNYPGVAVPNGEALRTRFEGSAAQYSDIFRSGCDVAQIDVGSRVIVLASGERISASAIVLATGVSRRELGVPGERELAGKGILRSGVGEKEEAKGKRVAVIGGGDAAFENALVLTEFAEDVVLVHRSDRFRAREEFVQRVTDDPRITVMTGYRVERIVGQERVGSLSLHQAASGKTVTLPVDIVLVRVGVRPNSELLRGKAAMDEAGYVRVDFLRRTDLPNIYAIGDVANPVSPTIATAVGDGAVIAKAIRETIN